MSVISKIAVLGLAGIGAAIAVAGMPSTASAEELRDTCHRKVTIAETSRADRMDGGKMVFNRGDRDRGHVGLNNLGWIRWYCTNADGVTAHREDGVDGAGEARIAALLHEVGPPRIVCGELVGSGRVAGEVSRHHRPFLPRSARPLILLDDSR